MSHLGEGDISQTDVGQDLALQQALAPRREVDSEIMHLRAKLRSVLRRVVELERHLGAVRDNRFLRRERIQLGLDISVTGEHGDSVLSTQYSGFHS